MVSCDTFVESGLWRWRHSRSNDHVHDVSVANIRFTNGHRRSNRPLYDHPWCVCVSIRMSAMGPSCQLPNGIDNMEHQHSRLCDMDYHDGEHRSMVLRQQRCFWHCRGMDASNPTCLVLYLGTTWTRNRNDGCALWLSQSTGVVAVAGVWSSDTMDWWKCTTCNEIYKYVVNPGGLVFAMYATIRSCGTASPESSVVQHATE
mmetsp:Transcript_33305/g.49357  ORF Transcript_33305/g.49357 Transcript_33305/m.49357 type:complete len:202 (-) Transcript_33305:189-794(-)